MDKELEGIKLGFVHDLAAAKTEKETELLRVKFLGKKGLLTEILKQMGKLPPEERPVFGEKANKVKVAIQQKIDAHARALHQAEISQRLEREKLDVTLPGRQFELGHTHPLSLVLSRVKEIFLGLGFSEVSGPHVELDYYNFEALNMPPDHPARDTQDTFYTGEKTLLRTQTSSVQIRHMEKNSPPIYIISPGKVFRSDSTDATHSPVFHQIEGLAVDHGITFANLRFTLDFFLKELFGKACTTRFRPHYFPYTEPSAEVDMQCFSCGGKGCALCKNEGWIEILGCGMLHPKVLENCGIDSGIFSGFAFGVGLERMAMLKHEIDDIRLFFENDMRFLRQFN